jgi:hypothetical protein
MSAVVVVTPLVIGSWPVISAAVTAAVASMGFTQINSLKDFDEKRRVTKNRAEIEVEDSEVFEGELGQEIVVERDGVRAVFSRDARGGLKLCMEGEHLSKSELKRLGEELLGRVTQQFVYHKLVSELESQHMNIVEESVAEDRTIKIRVRSA